MKRDYTIKGYTFTLTKGNNIQQAYARYVMSDAYYLSDVYGSWSGAKDHAYNYCRKMMLDLGGRDFKIIGANSSFFSVGFTTVIEDTDVFVFITHCNNYMIPLHDLL